MLTIQTVDLLKQNKKKYGKKKYKKEMTQYPPPPLIHDDYN